MSQVRSLRKSNNDQVAISVDMEPDSSRDLENEDDDKGKKFHSFLKISCLCDELSTFL